MKFVFFLLKTNSVFETHLFHCVDIVEMETVVGGIV
jgi:hypothetical protein